MRPVVIAALALLTPTFSYAAEPEVRDVRAVHRHGQTFVTWQDVAAGEDGAKVRYSLYRFDRPITADNLQQAELCCHGVLNSSARLFGTAFNMKERLDPQKPYSTIEPPDAVTRSGSAPYFLVTQSMIHS